jgi:hypothetical protein
LFRAMAAPTSMPVAPSVPPTPRRCRPATLMIVGRRVWGRHGQDCDRALAARHGAARG